MGMESSVSPHSQALGPDLKDSMSVVDRAQETASTDRTIFYELGKPQATSKADRVPPIAKKGMLARQVDGILGSWLIIVPQKISS